MEKNLYLYKTQMKHAVSSKNGWVLVATGCLTVFWDISNKGWSTEWLKKLDAHLFHELYHWVMQINYTQMDVWKPIFLLIVVILLLELMKKWHLKLIITSCPIKNNSKQKYGLNDITKHTHIPKGSFAQTDLPCIFSGCRGKQEYQERTHACITKTVQKVFST